MASSTVKIDPSWKKILQEELNQEYFDNIMQFLEEEENKGKTIYPPSNLIFNAFKLTPFEKVKVVILGQDPYHGPGEAMGLSFSVPKGKRVPPSLRNIYKEIKRDLACEEPSHGDLSSWASQGVLLLNAMLTVEHKKAGSHKKIGWQKFTDAVIKLISDHKSKVIFLLWGKFAQSKAEFIDPDKHHVLCAAHPSPLARNAFNNCKHFSKTNQLLLSNGMSAINWQIS